MRVENKLVIANYINRKAHTSYKSTKIVMSHKKTIRKIHKFKFNGSLKWKFREHVGNFIDELLISIRNSIRLEL